MTAISIMLEDTGNGSPNYRAVSGSKQSAGRTPGEALDALTQQFDPDETGTLVVVQQMRPDRYFTADQQARLAELMQRWRAARDADSSLSVEEQTELDALADAELKAATLRAEAMLRNRWNSHPTENRETSSNDGDS